VEIVVEHGERTVTVRDARPVVEPDLLTELLAAIGGGEDRTVVSLPFGFTPLTEDEEGAEPEI